MNPISEWDLGILDWIAANLQCDFLDALLPRLTHLSDAVVWIVLAALLIAIRPTRKGGLYMAVSLILGLLVCNVCLKPLVARIRPWEYVALFHPEHDEIELLVAKLTDFSFPSGHTIASFEGATALTIWKRKVGIPALVLATVISFSRLYLFVHYPTDVLAAVILGIANAFFGCYLVNRFYPKWAPLCREKWDAMKARKKAK